MQQLEKVIYLKEITTVDYWLVFKILLQIYTRTSGIKYGKLGCDRGLVLLNFWVDVLMENEEAVYYEVSLDDLLYIVS